MSLPETWDEALARGFTPVEDLKALLGEMKSRPGASPFGDHAMVIAPIDCNDPANDGKRCRAIPGPNGKVIILFCTAGACSEQSALIGSLD